MLIHATAESLLKRSCWRLIQSMSIPILVVSTPWCCGTVHTYIRRLKCAVWWGNVLVNYVYFWRENCQCLSRERQLVFTCTCMYPLPNPAGAYVPHEALICSLDHCLHTAHNSLCLHATLSLMGTVASRTCVPYDTINSAGCTSLRRYVGYVASRRDGKLNVKVHDTRQTFSRM